MSAVVVESTSTEVWNVERWRPQPYLTYVPVAMRGSLPPLYGCLAKKIAY